MAIFGGSSDWFQKPSGGETAPTLENLMKPKRKAPATTAQVAPVTFGLDELMASSGTKTAPAPVAATQAAPSLSLAAGGATQPPSDAVPTSVPSSESEWKYDFPKASGADYDFHGVHMAEGSQAYKDIQAGYGVYIRNGTGTWDEPVMAGVRAWMEKAARNFTPTVITQKDENGAPIATGYYDYWGNWVTTEDWSDVNAASDTYTDFINNPANQPTADYTAQQQQLQDLLNQWQDPNYLQNLQQQGLNWVDEFLGMAPGGFQAAQADLRNRVGTGIEGQAGLSDIDRARMERDVALKSQQAREETAQIMSQLQASGRGVQFFKQSEQIAAGLASAASQGYMAIEDANYARQLAQYQALSDQWGKLYEMGSMSMGQFLQATQMQAQNTLAAIGTEIAAISEQFQADQGAWSAYADALYKDVMIQMQYHGLVNETEVNDYEQAMAPYYADLQKRAIEAQEKANETDIFDILGLITQGVTAIFSIFG